MSKYAGLEGYDFNSSECYETQNTQEEKNEVLYNSNLDEQISENIDISSIKANDALKKFAQAEEQQYSQKFNKINYLKKKKDITLYQSSQNENETTAQQLRRLIKEVEDLKYRIEKEKKEALQNESESIQEDDDGDKIMNMNIPQKSKLTNPSDMLEQVSKLQTELEKMSMGIVDDNTNQDLNYLENSLIQQKMINQIKNCKINALNQNSEGETQEKMGKDHNNNDDLMNIDDNINHSTVPPSPPTTTATTATTTTIVNQDNNINVESNCITYQLYYSPKSLKQHQLSKISDLEDRITQIENILGVRDITNDSILFPSNNRTSMLVYAKGNIVTAIDSLDQQLQLLSQPKSFGNITMKINDTVKELEQFINLQKTKMEGEEKIEELLQMKEKVDKLYSRLESTEEYASIVIPLLTRLKTLQALHTEASQFSESIQMFSEQQEAMRTSVKDLQEMMEGLSESIQTNKTIVENNVDSISGRIDQLMERIKNL